MTPAEKQKAIEALQANPPYRALLRPQHFTAANFGMIGLDASQLEQYKKGTQSLWEMLVTGNDATRHNSAQKRLEELTTKLTRTVREKKEEDKKKAQQEGQSQGPQPSQQGPQQQTQPQNQQRTQQQNLQGQQRPQGQPQGQPQGLPQGQRQNTQQTAPQNSAPQGQPQIAPQYQGQPPPHELSPEDAQLLELCKSTATQKHWYIPPNMEEGSVEAEHYRQEATKRYTSAMYNSKLAERTVNRASDRAEELLRQGNADPDEVRRQFNQTKASVEDSHTKGTQFIRQLERQNAANAQGERPQSSSSTQGQNMQRQVPNSGVNHSGNQSVNKPVNPNGNFNAQQQTPSSRNFPSQRPPPNPMQGQNRPMPQPDRSNTPHALSHQEAIEQARSYSSHQPGTPQSAQQNLPDHRMSVGDPDNRKTVPGQPISKGWVPQAPQPVNMGASRPTLSGANNGPVGPMGQPAIQKPDTFLLQGPGDRVLERKKLDELYRQVCGADSGEADTMNPEVAEVSDARKIT